MSMSDKGAPVIDGVWERYDDKFAGCQVEVVPTPEGRIGVIVALPESMLSCGWALGDVKWEMVTPVSSMVHEFQDLYKAFDVNTRRVTKTGFVDASASFLTRDLLQVELEGKTQKWKRVGAFGK